MEGQRRVAGRRERLAALCRQRLAFYSMAPKQAVLPKVILEQNRSCPYAASEARRLDIQEIVLGVKTDIAGIYVVPGVSCDETLPCRGVEDCYDAAR